MPSRQAMHDPSATSYADISVTVQPQAQSHKRTCISRTQTMLDPSATTCADTATGQLAEPQILALLCLWQTGGKRGGAFLPLRKRLLRQKWGECVMVEKYRTTVPQTSVTSTYPRSIGCKLLPPRVVGCSTSIKVKVPADSAAGCCRHKDHSGPGSTPMKDLVGLHTLALNLSRQSFHLQTERYQYDPLYRNLTGSPSIAVTAQVMRQPTQHPFNRHSNHGPDRPPHICTTNSCRQTVPPC
jgi:hypothetical protein